MYSNLALNVLFTMQYLRQGMRHADKTTEEKVRLKRGCHTSSKQRGETEKQIGRL